MTYKEYKTAVIKYLLLCLEIEVQDRFANIQWDSIKDGTGIMPATNSEKVECNLIVTGKYLKAERSRLYSVINKELLRNSTPRQLKQKLVTEYLSGVSNWDFLNAIRVLNWRAGSRQPIKYYLVRGGIV